MSVVFSGTVQGVFTSNGQNKMLYLPTDVDYINVYNYTQTYGSDFTPTASTGVRFYWQRGLAAGDGFEWQVNAGSTAVNQLVLGANGGGFTLFNNTINVPGNAVAITNISNATPPVVLTGNTSGLAAGSIVRLFNVVGAQQLGGFDFTVGTVVASTSFTLAFMRSVATAASPGANAVYRIIPYDKYFYPPYRVISKIGSSTLNGANVAIVTLTVTHNFTVGQAVRLVIPQVTSAAFGMSQLNGVQATIVAVGAADTNSVTNTITINVDVSSFGSFAWPATGVPPAFTPPQVVPVGESTSQANASGVNPYESAELNEGQIGLILGAGANGPAGQANDVIYWVAGKSFFGGS
jgi:hypothetical protein